MTAPLVSLVVPSRGGAARLPTLVAALRAQTTPDWEAVVVLDGDIDDSAGVLARIAADLPMRTIVFTENQGRSAALNAGFDAATGDVLVRCDDDLVPAEDYVAQHAAAHSGRTVGAVGLVRNIFPDTAYARTYGRDWDIRYRAEAYAAAPSTAWTHWGANVSITRETWQRVGPYDTLFRAYGWEDVDYGFRLDRAGIPVVVVPELETEHRIAATTTAQRAQRAFYSGAAKLRFERKHGLSSSLAAPTSTWTRAVAVLAARLTEERAERAGRIVDASAGVLPDRVAGKAVALLVEASARAGLVSGRAGSAI